MQTNPAIEQNKNIESAYCKRIRQMAARYRQVGKSDAKRYARLASTTYIKLQRIVVTVDTKTNVPVQPQPFPSAKYVAVSANQTYDRPS